MGFLTLDLKKNLPEALLGEVHMGWLYTGANPEILKKRGLLYVSHNCRPTKKMVGVRWFEKVKIKLETISFW